MPSKASFLAALALYSAGCAAAEEAALKNVKETWKMEPGTKNGEPVEAWGKFAVTFKLED